MKLYWSINSIPELRNLSKKEKIKVWKIAHNKTFRHWQTWVSLSTVGIFAILFSSIPFYYQHSIILIGLSSSIGAGLGGFIFSQVATNYAIPYIRDEVNKTN